MSIDDQTDLALSSMAHASPVLGQATALATVTGDNVGVNLEQPRHGWCSPHGGAAAGRSMRRTTRRWLEHDLRHGRQTSAFEAAPLGTSDASGARTRWRERCAMCATSTSIGRFGGAKHQTVQRAIPPAHSPTLLPSTRPRSSLPVSIPVRTRAPRHASSTPLLMCPLSPAASAAPHNRACRPFPRRARRPPQPCFLRSRTA